MLCRRARSGIHLRQSSACTGQRLPAPIRFRRHIQIFCFKDQGSGKVPVSFKIPYRCNFGQNLAMVGAGDTLGNWDASRCVKMEWSDGDLWTAELALQPSSVSIMLEYKYVVLNRDGGVSLWKPGDNFKVEVAVKQQGSDVMLARSVAVKDAWDASIHTIDVEQLPQKSASLAEAESAAAEARNGSSSSTAPSSFLTDPVSGLAPLGAAVVSTEAERLELVMRQSIKELSEQVERHSRLRQQTEERLSQLTLAFKELADQVEALTLAIAVLTAAAQPPVASPMTVVAAVQAPLWDSVFEYGPAGTSPWAGAERAVGDTKEVPLQLQQQEQWDGMSDEYLEQLQKQWDGVGEDIPEEQQKSDRKILLQHQEQQQEQHQQESENLNIQAADNAFSVFVGQAGQALRVQNRTSIGLAAFRPTASNNGKPAAVKRAWWQPFAVPVHEAPSASTTHTQAEVSSKTWTIDNSSQIVKPQSVGHTVTPDLLGQEAQRSVSEPHNPPAAVASDAVSHLESLFDRAVTPLDMQTLSTGYSKQLGKASAISFGEPNTSSEPVPCVTDTTSPAAMATSPTSAPPSSVSAPVAAPVVPHSLVLEDSVTAAQQLAPALADGGGLVIPLVLSISSDAPQPVVLDCTLRLQVSQPVVISALHEDSAATDASKQLASVSRHIEPPLPVAASTLEDNSAADMSHQVVRVADAGRPPAAAHQSSGRRIDVTCGITRNARGRAFGVWLVDEYESWEQQTGPGFGRLPACVEFTPLEMQGVPSGKLATEAPERITPMQFLHKAGSKSKDWRAIIHIVLPGQIVGPSIRSVLSN